MKDSRVSEDENDKFLDLLEDYFAQPTEQLEEDERPQYGFQVGVTLENTEKPKVRFLMDVGVLLHLTFESSVQSMNHASTSSNACIRVKDLSISQGITRTRNADSSGR